VLFISTKPLLVGLLLDGVAFACGTRCHLLVHSLAQPYVVAGRGPYNSGPGLFRDNAPRSRSDNLNAAGLINTSRDVSGANSVAAAVVC